MFPDAQKLISPVSKWAGEKDEALLITTYILWALEASSSSGVPLLKRHVSFTPSDWAFKQVLDVENCATEILHHNPKNSANSQCPPTQAPSRDIPFHLTIMTSPFFQNTSTLCLRQPPCQSHLSQSFISLWQRRHQKYPGTDLPLLSSRQIILLSPPRSASRLGPLDVLWPWTPHSYLLLSEDESSYFHTWLLSHQKATWIHLSGIPES